MVSFTRLVKSVFWYLVAKYAYSHLINRIIGHSPNSRRGGNQPKDFQALLESVLAPILLKSTKGSGIRQQETTSAIGALLVNLMRSMEGPHDNKGRIIESDDYTVINKK